MGTIADKGTYLNTTKSLLKDKINNLGGSIDDNTTFRNYANQLQNVYDNLPKTEYQEGTEINLGKTLKGKLDYENGVVGIGQNKQDSTKGYQLSKPVTFNKSSAGITWTMKDNIITASGTANANTQSIAASEITNDMITSLSAGNYIVSGGTSDVKVQVIKYDNGSVSQLALDSGNNATFTLTETTNVICRGSISNGTALTRTETIKVMLESGSTAHEWEKYTGGQASPNPSYPQTINSVTGNQEVVVSGKNKCNITSATPYIYSSGLPQEEDTQQRISIDELSSNIIKISSSSTNANLMALTNVMQLKANTTYKISYIRNSTIGNNQVFVWGYSNNAYTLLARDNNQGLTELEFTTNSSGQIVLGFGKSISATGTATYSNIQIEQGSTATTYEPYITPTTHQLSLGNIEFNGIGNYKDELIYDVDEDKVYKNEKIGKHQFTGEETIHTSGSTNYTIEKSAYLSNLALPSETTDCLINKYKVLGPGALSIGQARFGVTNLLLNFDGVTTNETAFRASLATTILYAPLATPTLTEITDTTLINQVKALYNAQSINGTTIITSNGDLPLIIKCRALKGE